MKELPKPTNGNLQQLFESIDKVVFKEGGVYDEKAMTNNVVLTILEKDNIQRLRSLLEIDESNTGFYCMCLGTYAIELYAQTNLKGTIGFHHGVSIRYDKWNGDAELKQADKLLEFLNERGLTKPFQDRLNEERKIQADKVSEREWFEFAPKCFTKYWREKIDFSLLITDLEKEFPDKQSRIIALLQTFGMTDNFWTDYPPYEELPNTILKTIDIKDIVEAYLNSSRNDITQKGLGRFLCSFEFKKNRNKYLEFITDEIISDLENCFDRIGEKRGINEIFSLRTGKNNS